MSIKRKINRGKSIDIGKKKRRNYMLLKLHVITNDMLKLAMPLTATN